MTGTFWDQRFAERGYAYGEEPNVFLSGQLSELDPGALLLPAEGEGRNAVWSAVRGWRVHAFDTSTVGRDKALATARRHSVEIVYELRSVAEDLSDLEDRFDAAGLVFMHLPPEIRRQAHRAVARCLRPGGRLILEAFSKEQLERGTGGPREASLLYEVADLEHDFEDLEILSLKRCDVELAEGKYHRGESSVLRLLATRPG
jgi:SAM-dependent methyltransferase